MPKQTTNTMITKYFSIEKELVKIQNTISKELDYDLTYPLFDYRQYYWEICKIGESHESRNCNQERHVILFLNKDKEVYFKQPVTEINVISKSGANLPIIILETKDYTIVRLVIDNVVKTLLLSNCKKRKKALSLFIKELKKKAKQQKLNIKIKKRVELAKLKQQKLVKNNYATR